MDRIVANIGQWCIIFAAEILDFKTCLLVTRRDVPSIICIRAIIILIYIIIRWKSHNLYI